PDCQDYFMGLTNDFLKTKQSSTKKIFLTNGLKDFLDPEGLGNEQIISFTELIGSDENILCKYKIYKDEGHVPYPSLYHGLQFCFE
ncbi:MAG: hypothetical protein QNK35_03690, partial [Bacteroides sp.]|nr:hypothetical protein [Bacteroides sp.]